MKNLMRIAKVLMITVLFSFASQDSTDCSNDVTAKLDELGYFRYAEAGKIAELKSEINRSFERHKVLSTVLDDETLLPYDYRLYFCDGEVLFEMGGLETYLGYAKHAFEKRGLKLEWSSEISQEKGNSWNHRITVNGKEYVAFEGTMKRADIWAVAQLNFYRLLNDQLEFQKSDERIYPISVGEEGQFVFLSRELFDYVSTTFYQGSDFRRWEILYSVEKWKDVNGLK